MSKRKARSAKSTEIDAGRTNAGNPFGGHANGSPKGSLDLVFEWSRPVGLFVVSALFVVTPLVPSESAASKGTGVPLVMLWLVLLAAWLVAGLSRVRTSVRFGWTDAALALLVMCHVVSGLVMAWHGNPRQTYNMLWQWIGVGASFFLVRQLVQTAGECRALHVVMVALAVALACLGGYQYGYTMPQQRAKYQNLSPEERTRFIAEAGVDAPEGSRQRTLFENRLASREPMATFALTNSLAGFLAPWLVAGLGIAVANLSAERRQTRTLMTLAVAAVIIGACLLLTKSRTAYLACGVGAVLVALASGEHGRRLAWLILAAAVVVLVVLALGAIVVGGLDVQVLSEAPKSVLYRIQYWQSTAAMIGEHPWFGCGPGNFQEYYAQYKLPEASEMIADPHNFLFEIWATAGTPALFSLLALGALGTWRLWRSSSATNVELEQSTADPTARMRPKQRPDSLSPGQVLPILFGGLAGLILAYLYGVLVGYPLEVFQLAAGLPVIEEIPALWIVGLPPVVAVVWWLYPWIKSGRLPVAVPVCAIVALLINLLAAGGIGYPGVAQSLWLLLALALGLVSTTDDERGVPRFGLAVLLLAVLGVVFACHTTAYSPVLVAPAALAQGQQYMAVQRHDEAAAAFNEAAQADPYSPEPWQHIVMYSQLKWQFTKAPAQLERFDTAVLELLRRDAQSQARRVLVGDLYLAAFRQTHERSLIERAVGAYRGAVHRYPHGSVGHARLAWAYALSRDDENARRSAAEALRLDALTPHVDQKLSEATRMTFDPGPRGKLPEGVPDRPAERNLEELMRRLVK